MSIQGYYGYWYGEDVFPLDPSFEAVRTSTLMEVSLAASWLATLIWLSLGIYIIIVKRRTESNSRVNLDKSLLTSSSASKSSGVLSRKSNLGSSRASSVRDMDSLVLDSLVLASASEYECDGGSKQNSSAKRNLMLTNPLINGDNTEVSQVL